MDAPLREGHDPARPAVSSAAAASRLGRSRYAVAQAVKDGRLPGYGIRSAKRTRWFVYQDALPSAAARVAGPPPPDRDEPDDQIGDLRARLSLNYEVNLRLLAAIERFSDAADKDAGARRLADEANAERHIAIKEVIEALRQALAPADPRLWEPTERSH